MYFGEVKVAKDNLAPHEIPGKVTCVKEFPVTDHGKVDKRKLVTTSSQDLPSKLQGEDLLRALWAAVVGSPPSESDNFVSCGGDSFSAVTLVNSLEFRDTRTPTRLRKIFQN